MPNLLLVPVKVEALVVESSTTTVGALADFSRLPGSLGTQKLNATTPYLAASCETAPLSAPDLSLPQGIHLHWFLPDVFTRASSSNGPSEFLTVPNRWLVTRSNAGTLEKQWVVESDYLYPTGQTPKLPSLCATFPTSVAQAGQPNFHYLGRQFELADWPPTAAEHLANLTAVGYGSPAFASLYANCPQVFGAFDEGATPSQTLQYDIVGWYSDDSVSPYGQFAASFAPGTSAPNGEEWLSAIQKKFGWVCPSENVPAQMLCYARLLFSNNQAIPNPEATAPGTVVAIGNTGAEAVSAWLGEDVASAVWPSGVPTGGPQIVEDQMEAIRMFPQLAHQTVDTATKFVQARHDASFSPDSVGTLWTVRLQQSSSGSAATDEDEGVTLPPGLAAQLNELNTTQMAYNTARRALAFEQRRLFAAWTRYLAQEADPVGALAPSAAQIESWISNQALTELSAAARSAGLLTINRNAAGQVTGATASGGVGLAAAVSSQLKDLLNAVDAWNTASTNPAEQLTVQPVGAPRFWRANSPVVAMISSAVSAPPAQVDWSQCLIASLPGFPDATTAPDQNAINAALTGNNAVGISTWTMQPWSPLLVEWEATLSPVDTGVPGSFPPTFITSRYTLGDAALEPKPGSIAIGSPGAPYSGRNLLGAGAKTLLLDCLKRYIEAYAFDPSASTPSFDTQLTAALTKYAANAPAAGKPEMLAPEYSALLAYQLLSGVNIHSQALGGFNEAMLMQRPSLALPVADPFGTNATFVSSVATAVGQANTVGPQADYAFNPLRNGQLTLTRLRIVDTFGQTKNILPTPTAAPLILSSPMRNPALPGGAWLSARFAQAARLNMRWLAAANGAMEVNSHPATTPICGWFLPNVLDEALMVYDGSGKPLGSISVVGDRKWQPAPGGGGAVIPAMIENPYLAQVVERLVTQATGAGGNQFLSGFMQTLDAGLGTIDPGSYGQHNSIPMFVSRPVAVTRLCVGLELMEPPASSQSWQAFTSEVNGQSPGGGEFADTLVPVRIGSSKQFNDGVVGYWVEDPSGGLSQGAFQASNGASEDLQLSAMGPSVNLTMLVDPRGKVHGSCGLLPVKVIDIPTEQFADTLRGLSVTFLTAPVLSPSDKPAIPLPDLAGYAWEFIEAKADGGWKVYADLDMQGRVDSGSHGQEIRDGWLRLTKENKS